MGARARRAATALAVLVVGLVGGGATLGLAPTTFLPGAAAATCTSAGGVSVVVDFRELGGSTITACAPDGGGRSAAAVFASVGVQLSYAQRQPGFVCRVNGAPSSDPCVNASPTDAYWGLWWADGSSASWSYSTSGVGGLVVPAGGSVGWSWQQDRAGSGPVPPGVAPPVRPSSTPTPTPTGSASTPSSGPTSSPSAGGNGSGSGSGGGSHPTSSPSPGGRNGSTGSSSPSSSPSASPSGAPSASPSASESPSDSPAPRSGKDGGRQGAESGEDTGAGKRAKGAEASDDRESPGDSAASDDPAAGSDPGAAGDPSAGASSEAARPETDGPARVPAALSLAVVGLLAIAIAVGAVVTRRRRGV
ncbi:hypothetical protein [Nocardioides xinjiangensis]|uniref:hypothetical protein n=1 Tax=Nocardioides xinjiangensis TaxID=2817376 RepID=UPI001B300A73|nr:MULTISPECIES: hypothetical protein [unclassified Nocardioides]